MGIPWENLHPKGQEINLVFTVEYTIKRATNFQIPIAWEVRLTILITMGMIMELASMVKTVIHIKFRMRLINSRSVKNWFKCNKCKTFNNSFNLHKFFNKIYNNSSYRISSNSSFPRPNSSFWTTWNLIIMNKFRFKMAKTWWMCLVTTYHIIKTWVF